MSDREQDHPEAPGDEPPTKGFFALLPRRNLIKVVLMVFILIAVVYLQRHAGTIARRFSDVLVPALPPPSAPRRPPAAERGPPRVRLAPPPAPGPGSTP